MLLVGVLFFYFFTRAQHVSNWYTGIFSAKSCKLTIAIFIFMDHEYYCKLLAPNSRGVWDVKEPRNKENRTVHRRHHTCVQWIIYASCDCNPMQRNLPQGDVHCRYLLSVVCLMVVLSFYSNVVEWRCCCMLCGVFRLYKVIEILLPGLQFYCKTFFDLLCLL